MNDAAWRVRVVQARTERDDLRPQRGRRGTAQDAAVPVT
jgi:hypothetical protein